MKAIASTTKRIVPAIAWRLGYRISRISPSQVPADMGESFTQLYWRCKPYTLTSIERMYALYQAVHYLIDHDIPGDIVECGVWKGGSMMLAALTLQERGTADRALWLYDTYDGMSEPDERDRDYGGTPASGYAGQGRLADNFRIGVDHVRGVMAGTGYPAQRMHFVQGKVEETIPTIVPSQIALLRLDTDWYASTRHEMEHLYPLLVPGGVLIVDDYGYFIGARQAVDDYFQGQGIHMWLHRTEVGRVGVKA